MFLKLKLNKPLLVLLKIIIYMAILWGIELLIMVITGQSLPYPAFIITMLIIVPNRGKLSNFLQRIIDRSFYHKLYHLKQTAKSFSRELTSTIEYPILINKSVDFLNHIFSPNQFIIYLYQGQAFEKLTYKDVSNLAPDIIKFPSEKFNGKIFEALPDFYTVQEIWQNHPEYRPLINDFIDSTQFAYLLPLKASENVIGYLLFDRSLKYYLDIPEVKEYMLFLFKNTAAVLENAQIHGEVKRKSLQSQLLLEIVKNITATLNLREVLELIIKNLSELVSFDASAIVLVDKDLKLLQESVSIGYKELPAKWISPKLNQGLCSWVIKNKQGFIQQDVAKASNYYEIRPETRSQIAVPVISRNCAIGALILESNQLAHFTQADMELLNIFSGLASIAIRNAQLYEDSLKKESMESQLLVASKVQQVLLPKRVPAIKGINIDVVNIPSQIVGGDLYEVFRINQDQQGIAIGDVSGKGTPAAILMAVAYAGFKSILKDMIPVVTVIAKLNNFMVEATTSGYFVTFFYGIIDKRKNTFTYCNAGHNPPILMHKDLSIEYLDEGGMVLGFLANQQYRQADPAITTGDYLCFYTDGVTENKNPQDEEFGLQRLVTIMQENYGKCARDMRISIVDNIKKFTQSSLLQDDLTLLIVYIE